MIKTILLTLDGSELAEKALPYAQSLAEQFGAELLIVQVLVLRALLDEYNVSAFDQTLSQIRQEDEAYLSRVETQLQQAGLNVSTFLLESNHVANTILDFAQEAEADLIVMSTHGRSGLGRWVYGSVANQVLQHATCPVFLVRATEQAEGD